MTSTARTNRPSVRRTIRLVFLTTLSLCAVMVGGASATSCYVLDLNHPANAGLIESGFIGTGSGRSQGLDAAVNDIPIPTLSRLALLAGPFQSFQEDRVAKDPNCGRWGGRDKLRHGAIFFATTLGLQLFIESTFNVSKTEAFIVSAAVGTLVGVGKEYYDWKISDKDCFSEQDLLANTAGILSAGFVIMISN